jgi:hypothetical protein
MMCQLADYTETENYDPMTSLDQVRKIVLATHFLQMFMQCKQRTWCSAELRRDNDISYNM